MNDNSWCQWFVCVNIAYMQLYLSKRRSEQRGCVLQSNPCHGELHNVSTYRDHVYIYTFSGSSSRQTTTQFNLPAGNNHSQSFQFPIFNSKSTELMINSLGNKFWALMRIIWCRCSPINMHHQTEPKSICIVVNIWSNINVMWPWCDQYSVSYNLYFYH